MILFISIFVLQIGIALGVVFVLKFYLNRELEKAAIEKVMSLKASEDVKVINVSYGKNLPLNVEEELRALFNSKFVNCKIVFDHHPDLNGGLIIKIEEETLDFSLSSRLENFWS